VDLVTVANERRRRPAGGGLGSIRNLVADRWWADVELPRAARKLRPDVIHHPLPAAARLAGTAQVVTVHDLAFERLPERFDRGFRVYSHHAHRAAARAADAVICPSEATAADVREYWGVPAARIVVAHHGPGQELGREDRPPPTHFLYVGDDEPRKNLPTLLAAYDAYRSGVEHPFELVLAGSARADEPGVRVEYCPDPARLAELYAKATALVHPSLYEGFGLTVLEAMSAGAPVIAARSPGVVEVGGEAVRYVEPDSADELAAAMTDVGAGEPLRQELSERGRRRAAEFSWASSARAHLAAYSLAVERR
jgi:glycosyltransferase involved in cell wall biosynthesis